MFGYENEPRKVTSGSAVRAVCNGGSSRHYIAWERPLIIGGFDLLIAKVDSSQTLA
jgi:hypothetical protein